MFSIRAGKFSKLNKKIQKALDDRLHLFVIDEFNPRLYNHGLKGKYKDTRSIAITGDIRAHYIIHDSETRLFVDIGTHSELYRT